MPYPDAPRSLASLRAGEPANVGPILFDSVREHCARAGVTEGSRVVGQGVRGGNVAVETGAGHVVLVDGVLAHFVQVS